MLNHLLHSFKKEKLFYLRNIIFLALGSSIFTLIFSYVHNELSFDRHIPNNKNIYRVISSLFINGEFIKFENEIPYPVGPALKEELPEINNYARIMSRNYIFAKDKNGEKYRKFVCIADTNFVSLFNFKMLEGDYNKINEPKTLIISETFARTLYGNSNALGNRLLIFVNNNEKKIVIEEYAIVGIFKDLPSTSHLKVDIIVSSKILEHFFINNWIESPYALYVETKNNCERKELEEKITKIYRNYITYPGYDRKFTLQPLTDIYLNSYNIDESIEIRGDSRYTYPLVLFSLFVLAFFIINFLIIFKAKSDKRIKEFGIKQLFGLGKLKVSYPLLLESFIINVIASIFSILAVYLIVKSSPEYNLSIFNQFKSTSILSLRIFYSTSFWSIFSLIFLVNFIVSGVLPAILLIYRNPIKYIIYKRPEKISRTSNYLVIFQIAFSLILMTGTFIIKGQMNYMLKKDNGLDAENVYTVFSPFWFGENLKSNFNYFAESTMKYPEIEIITNSSSIPGNSYGSYFTVKLKSFGKNIETIASRFWIDHNYLKTFKIELLSGRDFKKNEAAKNVIINKSAVKLLNFKKTEDAINQTIKLVDEDELIIIGVVDDFYHYPNKAVVPLFIFFTNYECEPYISIRFKKDAERDVVLNRLKNGWNIVFPGVDIFDYFYTYDLYKKGLLPIIQCDIAFFYLSILALLISIFGFSEIIFYTIHEKTKEFGIRKVLGADNSNIFSLLYAKYLKMTIIGGILGMLITYIIFDKWLQKFAIKIDMEMWMFIVPFVVVLSITSVFTYFYANKISQERTINSLRFE